MKVLLLLLCVKCTFISHFFQLGRYIAAIVFWRQILFCPILDLKKKKSARRSSPSLSDCALGLVQAAKEAFRKSRPCFAFITNSK
jgi:hypothetical protein